MRLRRLAAPLLALLLVAFTPGAVTAHRTANGGPAPHAVHGDTTHVGPSIERRLLDQLPTERAAALKRHLEVAERTNLRAAEAAAPRQEYEATQAPPADATAHELVGTTKTWLALDQVERPETFGYYEKDYRLAAVGEHIEIWVAIGEGQSYDEATGVYRLPFPEGDCRNDPYEGVRVEITPGQLNHLVNEFDENIHPKETAAFSTPPPRNGEQAQFNELRAALFPQFEERPAGYFATPGGAERTVTLIDNVRDPNFYLGDEQDLTYIAGFFSPLFNAAFDRNVMTIDAWDWLHRTGLEPPDDPSGDRCLNSPARPQLYEGTYAHEWQHLLQSYVGGETIWMNEGLSDWAQTLTGYADPAAPITDPDLDSHIQCFYGYLSVETPANPNPRADSGPENSLTSWLDQGAEEILCDYGAAYTMIEYLVGQYGEVAASFLHNDADTAGLESVAQLGLRDDRSAQQLVHDWAAMIALDAAIDEASGDELGDREEALSTPTLAASVNWDENDAYDSPGAPPNGSDYVRLRDAEGSFLAVDDLEAVTFDGATEYRSVPTQWVVTDEAPGLPGDPVLWSTAADSLDSAVVYEVAVPESDPNLRFATIYEFESGFDFGVVQVSTDGGETYTSLANELTTTESRAAPNIAGQLPGLTGSRTRWTTTTFDLSAYAGETVLLSFRALTDPGVTSPGWWIDDVSVGGEPVTDGRELGRSASEVDPPDIAGWSVRLVSIDSEGGSGPRLAELAIGENFTGLLDGEDLGDALDSDHDVVAAIVTHDEPTETIEQYAPYTLTVDGEVQPGGR